MTLRIFLLSSICILCTLQLQCVGAVVNKSPINRPKMRIYGPLTPRFNENGRLKPESLADFFDEDDIPGDLSKRQTSDDYGHMRFGKRGQLFDDYGHMRFGRSNDD